MWPRDSFEAFQNIVTEMIISIFLPVFNISFMINNKAKDACQKPSIQLSENVHRHSVFCEPRAWCIQDITCWILERDLLVEVMWTPSLNWARVSPPKPKPSLVTYSKIHYFDFYHCKMLPFYYAKDKDITDLKDIFTLLNPIKHCINSDSKA